MTLAEHPAYDGLARALVCAICRNAGDIFECMDVVVFEGHFLYHAPSAELAKAFLLAKTYTTLARAHGWVHFSMAARHRRRAT